MAIDSTNQGYIDAQNYANDPNNVDVPDRDHQKYSEGIDTFQLTQQQDVTDLTSVITADAINDRVGINEATPLRELHIHKDGATQVAMHLTNGTTGKDVGSGFDFQLDTDGDAQILQRENGRLLLYTNNAVRQTIDSAGNVGIGTSAPVRDLHVHDASTAYLMLSNNTSGQTTADGFQLGQEGLDTFMINREAGHMRFSTNNTEALRLDSSQNLLVGKTSISSAVAGCEIKSGGQLFATKDGDYCARFNRLTTDGAVIQIQQAGVLVGSIGTEGTKLDINGGGSLAFSINGSEKVQVESTGITRPGTDNTQSLGKASFRWSTVYAGTGSINTSDERTKTEVVDVETLAMDAGDLISVKQFKFKDAVESKGSDARLHFGVIAQEVKAAFESVGLDGFAYGVLCYDEWEDEFKTVTVEPAVYETNIITPAVEGVEAVAEELNEDGDVIVEAVEAVEAVEEVTEQVLVTPAVTEEQLVTPAGNRYGVRYDELMALKIACLERKLSKSLRHDSLPQGSNL